MRRFENIVCCYWEVGTALRHPDAKTLSAERALKTLNSADRLRVDTIVEVKLRGEMHTLKYDIIEGNTKWREPQKQKALNSRLILFTRS